MNGRKHYREAREEKEEHERGLCATKRDSFPGAQRGEEGSEIITAAIESPAFILITKKGEKEYLTKSKLRGDPLRMGRGEVQGFIVLRTRGEGREIVPSGREREKIVPKEAHTAKNKEDSCGSGQVRKNVTQKKAIP